MRFPHIRDKGQISGVWCRICAFFSLKVRVRLKRGRVDRGVVMTEGGESFFSPGAPVPIFVVGDMVHVFEGTGVGLKGGRDVGWFGKVVGMEGGAYLVRNRLLAAKGRPCLVDGQFMRVQVDYGLECGSGERVHFRSLGKRTRERILQSADERNNCTAKEALKELTKVKIQKSIEKEAYLLRREQMEEMGTSSRQAIKRDYEEQIQYWQSKNELLDEKMRTNLSNYKRISGKKEVMKLACIVLALSDCPFCLISCFDLSEIVVFSIGSYAIYAGKSTNYARRESKCSNGLLFAK